MGKLTRFLMCLIYLLLLHIDQFVLTNPAESINLQSKDQVRPAVAACEKYKKTLTELDRSVQPETTDRGNLSNYQVKRGEFPYAVVVGYSSKDAANSEIKYSCAGTLISEKHVLLAAHCVTNLEGRTPVEVVLGATDLDKTTETDGVQKLSISRITTHPQFDQKFSYFDIAILELKDPVRFTINVNPTCLITEPLSSSTAGTNSMVVLGWRNVKDDQSSSRKLVKVENAKFVEKDECSKSYDHSSNPTQLKSIPNGLDDGMICVTKSDDNQEADPCWAISGAPVLLPSLTTSSGFITAGLSAFGYKCGANKPSVAVSVHKYLNWIEDQVWPTGV